MSGGADTTRALVRELYLVQVEGVPGSSCNGSLERTQDGGRLEDEQSQGIPAVNKVPESDEPL